MLASENFNIVDWDERWRKGETHWDVGRPSPATISLVSNEETKRLIPAQGVGLVPGCGRGYDVMLLATKDRHMTGLDLSRTAIDLCKKNHPDARLKNYEFIVDDFFTFTYPHGGYDFIYDYRFLCAMPPYIRSQWAARYAEIVKKGGILVCLMVPIEENLENLGQRGPPYAVSEQLYSELLSSAFELVYVAKNTSYVPSMGKERISVWKRRDN